MSRYYSVDGEAFNHDSIEECINDMYNDGLYIHAGMEMELYQGELQGFKASDFAPSNALEDMLVSLSENAGDTCGECAERWLDDVSIPDNDKLKQMIKDAIDEWAGERGYEPTFGLIPKPEKIMIKILDGEFNYELLPTPGKSLGGGDE